MGKINKKAQKRKLGLLDDEDDQKRHKSEPVIIPPKEKVDEVAAAVSKLTKKQKKAANKKKKAEEVVEEEPQEVEEEDEVEVDEEEQNEDDGDDNEDEDEEESDEDEEDSDSDSANDDLLKDTGEKLDFDIEAFPLEDEDKEGINNMLTQIFLRADIDLVGLGKALIAQSPSGCVIGPAEDVDDEDNTTSNVVYGLISMLPQIDKDEKYAKDIFSLLQTRANKHALASVARDFDSALTSSPRLGLFVNERMLHFPSQVGPPACKSLLEDLNAMKEKPSHVLYIHKIRVVEDENEKKEAVNAPSTSTNEGGKKKKKGKAEKKRAAAAAMAAALIEYENEEDGMLLHLPKGTAIHFDYPVHTDIDAGSKFHIVKSGTISKTPYRRAVIMDLDRFKSFLNAVANS